MSQYGINLDELSDSVVSALEQNLDCEDDMPSLQKKLDHMSSREAMEAFLNWHGIIGYTDMIINAWESISSADRSVKS